MSACYTLAVSVWCVCLRGVVKEGVVVWGRKGRLMDIILMGSGSSSTLQAIRTGKRTSEDW